VPLRPKSHNDAIEVVESKSISEELDEIGYDHWMGEEVAKRITPGPGPGKHAIQITSALLSFQRSRLAGERLLFRSLTHLVRVVVNGIIALSEFIGSQGIGYHEISIEVEEVLFIKVH
tara:strand:- start:1012 stop:1365 length:354 start_codon:yes stop_codon:yes gene_type:complete